MCTRACAGGRQRLVWSLDQRYGQPGLIPDPAFAVLCLTAHERLAPSLSAGARCAMASTGRRGAGGCSRDGGPAARGSSKAQQVDLDRASFDRQATRRHTPAVKPTDNTPQYAFTSAQDVLAACQILVQPSRGREGRKEKRNRREKSNSSLRDDGSRPREPASAHHVHAGYGQHCGWARRRIHTCRLRPRGQQGWQPCRAQPRAPAAGAPSV